MGESIRLLLQHAGKKILFVGIGNILRCDDGIGVYIVNGITENTNISKLIVEVSLENYISKINMLAPDLLVLVDCIDFNEKPGYFDLIAINTIIEPTIHSHHITLTKTSVFFNMPVFVLGIQPANLNVGEGLTNHVKQAGDKIIGELNEMTTNKLNIPILSIQECIDNQLNQ